ncbi:intradiol ring-cleavage dioxygenase [Auraticoccus monumenti]|uniref:Dioxygenase n=1 Tax=Auraticoccus monumenti TaxID=675864 RepID=A0A1G6T2Y5_9ACTN|nr:intradiol ring-cleavage dioxygenase [Auraticoccus monumenti]SDD23540.1 Dioxygenase [Auraticoccus monumenti]
MTTDQPTYEGRPLPRPEDEVVDQGLAFDVVTLTSRRRLLAALGGGLSVLGLAACGVSATAEGQPTTGSATTSSGEIPDETAGPYPGDGSNGPDVLEQSGIVRSDLTSSFGESTGTAEGVPMTLELTVTDLAAGQPYAGAAVYLWHCTREGGYSMYSEGIEDENYLRGVQVADADGLVRFTSIVPGCYDGRWPHLHFEVYPDEASIADAADAVATSQLAVPQDVAEAVYAEPGYESSVANLARTSLDSDNVFSDGAESQLPATSGDTDSGYVLTLTVGVDTSTEPTGGGMGGGGGAPGGAGGTAPSGPPPGRPS